MISDTLIIFLLDYKNSLMLVNNDSNSIVIDNQRMHSTLGI